MNRAISPAGEGPRPAAGARGSVPPGKGPRPGDVVRGPLAYGRETVESIVIAFTLALLFRAFEAEAFVIPTGSMAPVLMGRHKDLACESCGRDFRVGCSAEEDDQSQSLRAEAARLERELAELRQTDTRDNGNGGLVEREERRRRIDMLESENGPIGQLRARLVGKMVPAARCPNCSHLTRLVQGEGAGTAYDPRYPSFSGDRILVDKFAYDFAEPRRWDVVVFKYPEEAKTNYIKRLVGLPGETLSIIGGDVWISRADDPLPVIARKPPGTMRAMLQCVHDSRFVSRELDAAGWPARWSDWSAPGVAGAARWDTSDHGRSYAVAAAGTAVPATLRYRHFVPSAEDWRMLERGEPIAARAKPSLIDDFQPYNAIGTRPHWVGDLAIECVLEVVRQEQGQVAFELVEAGRVRRCSFDLATGAATLAPAGLAEPGTGGIDAAAPRAPTPVKGTGSWRILFANVDDELTLFVNDRQMAFDRPTQWSQPPAEVPLNRPVTAEVPPGSAEPSDLAPIGVTALGVDARVRDLRVLRDTYYISASGMGVRPDDIFEEDRLEFALGPGQYFFLGDNSAASKDSRLWLEGHHVDRELLIGRAIAIFWPHAVPAKWSLPVKIGGLELRLPSWPNFGRMRFVR
jgi:signal peptidase I